MKIYQKADGSVLKSAREYDVAADTVVMFGQVVTIAEGLVVPAVRKQTGRVLGIAAETHTGVEDALNSRNNGMRILVYDCPDVIAQCAAPEIAAAGGSETTLVCAALSATFADDDFNGGYVKLLRKADESANTDEIGKVRRVTDYTANSKTLTLESGGTPTAGDVYALFPPIGFAKGQLDGDIQALDLADTCALALKVVGMDRDLSQVNLMARTHALGAEE